jgi:hypothetical protein
VDDGCQTISQRHLLGKTWHQGHAVVTVRLDVGYRSPPRLDRPRDQRKSHHADAIQVASGLFCGIERQTRSARVAEESMHMTADRLPAARTRVQRDRVHHPNVAPTHALCVGGQEGAGRSWCWDRTR